MKRRLMRIFSQLYSTFGPQRWWPAESSFEVIIGAILTQNTSWQNVEKAILKLKTKKLLRAENIQRISLKQLASAIKSSGFYNVKALRVKEFVKFFLSSYSGSIKKLAQQELIPLRKQLLAVKGIGQETADSILLYALNKPVFVIDAYTLRIFSRHGLIKESADYATAQDIFMRNLKGDTKLFNEYHALLVKVGKDFCRKQNPKCEICPLHGQ